MEEKTHYLYGMHSVMEALESNKRIEKVLFKQGLEGTQFRQLVERLQEKEIPVQFAPAEKLNNITNGNHQGVIAFISQVEYIPIEEMVENAMKKSSAPLFILLDGVSDVRNFGAIARSAECAGVAGIILPAKGGAAVNADAIKTSAGALLRIATSKVANLRVAIYYLIESGFQIVAADEKAKNSIYEVDFKKPTAIIMGSENKGISDSVLNLATEKARIPLLGAIGSLNVSVAASVVMFEAVRQKNV
ncbi:MAG: 23S rRNA (guanosine(2251)-2'-O)-methyltransferase RlmB [Bacteroidales bacterium]|jgi:23S rRNA (guanosine2251-2'-O)-methyltransferase